MTRLAWDQPGERLYEGGVDRGVLYLSDGSGVPWNGLMSMDAKADGAGSTPLYLDGVKFFDDRNTTDFVGVLKALTFPDEFRPYDGILELGDGWLRAYDQPVRELFGLSYRTLIGNDVDRDEHGYKIHLLYNLSAFADTKLYTTVANSLSPTPFSWTISGVPVAVPGGRPAVHFVIDSREIDPLLLVQLEDALYGTETYDARLLTPAELLDYHLITITDNGDGTWTAEGPAELITMTDETTFQITGVNATYSDAVTYDVSTT